MCRKGRAGSAERTRKKGRGSGERVHKWEVVRVGVNGKWWRIMEAALLIFMSSLPSVRVMPGLEEHLKGDSYPVVARS